jgi:ubiquitin carboxyl-terminal hydrolase L5
MSSTWCTIESDPGVFSELISTMGVEGVAVEEIFTLDGGMETQTSTGEQYGLILLFKWVPGEGGEQGLFVCLVCARAT